MQAQQAMIIDNSTNAEFPNGPFRQRWRVGIAGAGWVTQYHLPAWRAQGARALVMAIADPDRRRVEDRRSQHAIPAGYASAEAMLDDAGIDILDVCAPPEAHAPLVRLAAARGLAVICQKPLAGTLAEAEALVAGIDRSIRLMVHDNWRFRATYRRIREWLDAGSIGRLRRVELHYLSSGMIEDSAGRRPALIRQPNFASIERLLVAEVLIHHLDTLRFLLGELELLDADLARSNEAIVGEDIASLRLRRCSDGLPVELVGNLAAHGEPPQARDQLRIFGAHATVLLDGHVLSASGRLTARETFDPERNYVGAYVSAIGHFLDALERGAPFETNPCDHLRTLALVEAAYAAHRGITTGLPLRYAGVQ
jgi:predicted dehydrogenase